MFLHGLTGNRADTWTKTFKFKGKEVKTFWPEELLPQSIPTARIITYGYDADVIDLKPFRMASNNGLQDHATDLCTNLAHIRTHYLEVSELATNRL